jgi:alanine dehydrogenase
VVVLFDGETGKPLAVLDSMEITSRRTAAATAVAATYLARPESTSVTIVGCGEQGRSQLRGLVCVRHVRRVFAFDLLPERADAYAGEMSAELGVIVEPTGAIERAARHSDIVVTCTPATSPILSSREVSPGTFVAAVGADAPHKWELDPGLLSRCTVVVDSLEQCATIGDLHHAIDAGAMRREDVHADLSQIVGGQKCARSSPEEVIVFDSTGTALEDVAAAALVYRRASAASTGVRVAFEA